MNASGTSPGAIRRPSAAFSASIEPVARLLLGEPNRVLSKPGRELRFGRHGSLSADLRRDVWHDHEVGAGGGVLDLVIHAGAARTQAEAATWLRGQGLLTAVDSLEESETVPRSRTGMPSRDRGRFKRFPRPGPSLSPYGSLQPRPLRPPRSSTPIPPGSDPDRARRIAGARTIWREGRDPAFTLAERYLVEERGLELPEALCGRCLRFHPRLWRRERQAFGPGMVAALRPIHGDLDLDAEPLGILRWFFSSSEPYPLDPKTGRPMICLRGEDGKRLKRGLGQASGCAIKLSPDEAVLGGLAISEGLESGLAVYCNGWRPTWAMGSSGAMKVFEPLPGVEALTVFADHDPAGMDAAQTCAAAWRAAGAEARVLVRAQAGRDAADEASLDAGRS